MIKQELPVELALINRVQQHPNRTAILAEDGRFSYQDLLRSSAQMAEQLLQGAEDLKERRVAFLLKPGCTYVKVQWGIWRAGGIAVPLSPSHPPPEWEYVIQDTGADIVIASFSYLKQLQPITQKRAVRLISDIFLTEQSKTSKLPQIHSQRRAMILYTSGTTSRPKGVVYTHRNIQAQIEILVKAWQWQRQDHILHVLPLHHVHGIINVLSCALWSGAICEMLPQFDAKVVWQKFVQSELTLFMAVPTIYSKLINAWEAGSTKQRQIWSKACDKIRLMVSGSAALPVQVMEKWHSISGHSLLERYGMTEIGMALSNPLHGKRVPRYVGTPLPGIELRLVTDRGDVAAPGTAGEIQVKGTGVFLEYWRRGKATQKAFQNGWFQTGDVAILENGLYRILGRKSIDIIKTGGYKVSALEIEEVLRSHPDINECAVVGLPDLEWGECVALALVPRFGQSISINTLRQWAKSRLAPYKVPTRFLELDSLPRNLLGKVNKSEVVKQFKPIKLP